MRKKKLKVVRKRVNPAIKKLFESPAISREEYYKMRNSLPSIKLKKLLDLAYDLDLAIENIKTLSRIMGRVPIYYLSIVYDRFYKLQSYYLSLVYDKLSDEEIDNIRSEILSIMKSLNTTIYKLREPSYNVLSIVIYLKYFLYYFIYAPLHKISDEIDSIIMEKWYDLVKNRVTCPAPPSEFPEK